LHAAIAECMVAVVRKYLIQLTIIAWLVQNIAIKIILKMKASNKILTIVTWSSIIKLT